MSNKDSFQVYCTFMIIIMPGKKDCHNSFRSSIITIGDNLIMNNHFKCSLEENYISKKKYGLIGIIIMHPVRVI